jgi:non-canonical poly(A) RNA polymerase PAPD5/7
MDPTIGWYQPEQEGPAKVLWSRIWDDASKRLNNLNLNSLMESRDFIPLDLRDDVVGHLGHHHHHQQQQQRSTNHYHQQQQHHNHHQNSNHLYNRTRRKANDNRASTFGMNANQHELIGTYGGCPWKFLREGGLYSKGIMG